MTIRPRRGGYQVIVYAGIDPVTGHQRQIARQVKGKREAERLEARLRAEVADGHHRGTSARTVAELLDVYLARRETSDKPLSPATLNDYAVLSGALGLAARNGWIGFNPARLARPPAAGRRAR